MRSITVLESPAGDWQALYVDGELVQQGHSIPLDDIIELFVDEYGIEYCRMDMEAEEFFRNTPGEIDYEEIC